ncbi:MAG: hypothetical protein ACYTG6_01240, partial [Planctomycetota bacterium]
MRRGGGGGRLWAACTALTALPLFLLGDTLLSLARGWRLRGDFPDVILAITAAPVVAVSCALLSRRSRAWMRTRASKLTLLGLSLTISFLSAELVLHVVRGPADYVFHLRHPNMAWTFQPTPDVMPGVRGPSTYSTNALGLRGPDVPLRENAYRILCVGGSTTECLYLDDTETWPRQLMIALADGGLDRAVWVGDAGKSGYATADHVQFVEGSTLVEEMDCVVFYVGANDLGRALLDEPIAASVHLEPLCMDSHLLVSVRNLLETVGAERAQRVEDVDGSVYDARRAARRAGRVVEAATDLAGALAAYRDNVRRLIDGCRRRDLRPVFVSQAVLWG